MVCSAAEVGVNRMQDMAALWISSLLLLFIGSAVADFDDSICDILKRSSGLIPPPLPTNFELKGEQVDHLRKYTVYEEMYFDYTNSRAKYMFLERSIEHHFLFDYETSQIVMWDLLHAGANIKRDPLSHVCVAANMDESLYHNLFGYQDGGYSRPKMFNSNQVLRYGGQYVSAFNNTGRLEERGLLTNNFIGCLYDSSVDATMSASYYFTNEKVEPAGATEAKVVTGKEDGYLSVPVRFDFAGVMDNEDGDMQPFKNTMSVSWFKGEPEFEVGTFQIPPWIYCKDYRGRKDMTKFPTAFSTRITLTQFQVDIMGEMAATESQSYEEIFYYGEKRLARRDFTPNPFLDSEIHSKFQSYTPVSTIYDFNQGLRYTINKPTGRCYISPIYENEYFDTHEDLTYRKLGTPEEIFLMETDEMEYKGKAFTRDIECDVWTGKFFDKRYNATFVKETYISTNGWHEAADEMVEYGVRVKHVILKQEMDGDLTEGVAAYNFLKFKAKPPRLVLFDINNCVEYITHKQYAIILDVDDAKRDLLIKYRFNFLETAQYYLADMAQVLTPLRIQRLQLRRKRPSGAANVLTFLLFTILDKADLRDIPVVVAQTGADLQGAVVNLQKLIDAGRFNIMFYPPGSEEATEVHVNPGDMYFVTPSGNLTFAPIQNFRNFKEEASESNGRPTVIQHKDLDTVAEERFRDSKKEDIVVQHEDDNSEDVEEVKGMTAGHLALLAIAMLFIGVGIGIAVMYLYVRMYSDTRVVDRIKLTESTGSGGGGTSSREEETNLPSTSALP